MSVWAPKILSMPEFKDAPEFIRTCDGAKVKAVKMEKDFDIHVGASYREWTEKVKVRMPNPDWGKIKGAPKWIDTEEDQKRKSLVTEYGRVGGRAGDWLVLFPDGLVIGVACRVHNDQFSREYAAIKPPEPEKPEAPSHDHKYVETAGRGFVCACGERPPGDKKPDVEIAIAPPATT